MEAPQFRPWSDLQPELLGLILKRLPVLADRVRLRAVCQPWRSNSLEQPLPLPFPWLTLPDGIFLNIPGGEIHRMPIPEGACCQGSIDNWLFLTHNDDVCSLMNPFSNTTLELPKLAREWKRVIGPCSRFEPVFYKLAVPSPLDSSPNSLVAAVITDNSNCRTLCISQPPIATDSLRGDKYPVTSLADIAFFDGKLYALSGVGNLLIFELDDDLVISSFESIIDYLGDLGGVPQPLALEMPFTIREYLVECGGRLLTVTRWIHRVNISASEDVFEDQRTATLEVFEADLQSSPRRRWRRVHDLGGHALFLGQHGSKSLPPGECSEYQEDCIYFMCDYPLPSSSANPLRDSGVYNVRNGRITPLMSEAAAAPLERVGQWRPAWVFPSAAM
ncbi:hypothetical protein ACQJBY_063550 [Aegilops geniculata]